jgi:hypothetical protein
MQRRAASLTGGDGKIRGKKIRWAGTGETTVKNNNKLTRETIFENETQDRGGARKNKNKINLKQNESLLTKPIREPNKILEGHVLQPMGSTLQDDRRSGTTTQTQGREGTAT